MNPELVELYSQLAEHTRPKCAGGCRVPLSCCSPEYGELAAEYMAAHSVELPASTGNKKCRFLGSIGCVVEPHWRPACTMHVCCINAFGLKPGDQIWTAKYYQLRDQIEELAVLEPEFI